MGRMAAKANKIPIALRINAHLLQQIDELAKLKGRYRSEIIDRACEEYIARELAAAKSRSPKKS